MRIIHYPCLIMMSTLLGIVLCVGCSGKKDDEAAPIEINPEKDIHELYKNVVKERDKTAVRPGHESKKSGALRKKHLDAADKCLKKYMSCLEQCKDNACEERCFTSLSICEKDLPQDMKTVKER